MTLVWTAMRRDGLPAALCALAACSSGQRAAPQSAPAPVASAVSADSSAAVARNLVGTWAVTLVTSARTMTTQMTIAPDHADLVATMQPTSGQGGAYRSSPIRIDGSHLSIRLRNAEGGEAQIDADLRESGMLEGRYAEQRAAQIGVRGRATSDRVSGAFSAVRQ